MTALALIPPHHFARRSVRDQGTYLLLPELFKHEEYRAYVSDLSRNNPRWVTLDNGAFEGELVPTEQLIGLAETYNVDEVVIPDTLQDANATLKQLDKFLQDAPLDLLDSYQLMIVVQGKTIAECESFIWQVADEPRLYSRRVTFGLPKHLIVTTNNLLARIILASTIREALDDNFNIHFLGMSPHNLMEITHTRRLHVRSMDTSLPYVYAAQGRSIGAVGSVVLERKPGYFDLDKGINRDLIEDNVNVVRTWCNAN
jgi:hypothetical protein